VNKGTSDQVVNVIPKDFGVGDRYYVYTLTGIDNSQFPQELIVNNEGPAGAAWGPLDGLENIPANAYQIGEEIKINSPAYSVEYVLIEPGSHFVSVNDENRSNITAHFKLEQNYPNPFNPQTTINYSLAKSSIVTLKIYDMLSREVETLIQNKRQAPGKYEVVFNASNFSSGIYFYKLITEEFIETKKMLFLK
jgi:hypothetical protein